MKETKIKIQKLDHGFIIYNCNNKAVEACSNTADLIETINTGINRTLDKYECLTITIHGEKVKEK